MRKQGFTDSGAQRFQCLGCRLTFTWKNPGKKLERGSVWFERWMKEGYSIRQLMNQSGHSRRKLQKVIAHWLQRPPVVTGSLVHIRSIILDGTYIENRRHSAFVCMDGTSDDVIAGGYGIKEGSREMFEFLLSLKRRGMSPNSATIDGLPAVFRCLKLLWPSITIQRCLVHIQRQGLMWCRRFPKRTNAKALRKLFLCVMMITTKEEKDSFLSDVRAWEERYGSRLASMPERGWVLSDLKRARSMLLHALPNMFYYLNDPTISKSTNGLEGYFSRTKGLYRRHRGLSKAHRSVYFRWHFFFGQHRFSNTK